MGTGDTRQLQSIALQTLDAAHPFEPARGLFEPDSEVVVARAPGRLDVMGGIADYSGALVLQWPIREATCAAVQPHAGARPADRQPVGRRHVAALRSCRSTRSRPAGAPVSYDAARAWFAADPRTALGGLRRRGVAGARTRAAVCH